MATWDRLPSPETRLLARRLRAWMVAVPIGLGLLALLLDAFAPNRPVEYEDELAHFYYGSIGSDLSAGIPVKVLRVLPEVFPEHLPAGAERHDLTAFGFIQEPGEPLPIGFSVRRRFIDLAGMNCAACHTGQVRGSETREPLIVPGMPANTVDLHAWFGFLFDVAADEDFTARTLLAAMDEAGLLAPGDRLIYRFAVPQLRDALRERAARNAYFFRPEYTAFGPGRVNTFDTFKTDQFRHYYAERGITPEAREMYGIVDFPSVWNQTPREGLALHWDGNQTSVRERNFSAAIGAGTEPQDMDVDSLLRVEAWLDALPPPDYPFPIDAELARRGQGIYQARCAACHDFGGERIATVEPLERIGTDPHRVWSYTEILRDAQQDYTEGYFWAFRNFTVTDGYTSQPLDGIWARAPYLHNGSVPSMWDLLTPEDKRPVAFELGVDVYDQARMGFQAERLEPAGDGFVTSDGTPYEGEHFVLDTRLRGNANSGHTGPRYGTDLGDGERRALIEYLKTR